MKKKQCIIVIPVYRNPNSEELVSLRRCCEVLGAHEMSLVAPEGLDVQAYEELWNSYGLRLSIKRFAPQFFDGIAGYNRLLLSECFYQAFAAYEHMLICQPDAYVFEDKLTEWCDKGYDFVGAPLVGRYDEQTYRPDMDLVVGNGGFCLRNISYALAYFAGNRNVFSPSQIARRINIHAKPLTRWVVWLLMVFGWRNKPRTVADCWQYNEDNFWSIVLADSQYAPKLPTPEEALEFAFERFPAEMYRRTGKFPFGCHAWRKYEFEDFWARYIK